MEKTFEATIRNADTNEILTRISSYSQEGLEEEMGKTKWAKFASRDYEEEVAEADEAIEELVKPDCLKTDEEIKADINFDVDGNECLPDDVVDKEIKYKEEK